MLDVWVFIWNCIHAEHAVEIPWISIWCGIFHAVDQKFKRTYKWRSWIIQNGISMNTISKTSRVMSTFVYIYIVFLFITCHNALNQIFNSNIFGNRIQVPWMIFSGFFTQFIKANTCEIIFGSSQKCNQTNTNDRKLSFAFYLYWIYFEHSINLKRTHFDVKSILLSTWWYSR